MNEAGLGEHFIGKTNEIFAKEFKADPVGFVKATYNSDLPELALRRPRPPPEDVRQLFCSTCAQSSTAGSEASP